MRQNKKKQSSIKLSQRPKVFRLSASFIMLCTLTGWLVYQANQNTLKVYAVSGNDGTGTLNTVGANDFLYYFTDLGFVTSGDASTMPAQRLETAGDLADSTSYTNGISNDLINGTGNFTINPLGSLGTGTGLPVINSFFSEWPQNTYGIPYLYTLGNKSGATNNSTQPTTPTTGTYTTPQTSNVTSSTAPVNAGKSVTSTAGSFTYTPGSVDGTNQISTVYTIKPADGSNTVLGPDPKDSTVLAGNSGKQYTKTSPATTITLDNPDGTKTGGTGGTPGTIVGSTTGATAFNPPVGFTTKILYQSDLSSAKTGYIQPEQDPNTQATYPLQAVNPGDNAIATQVEDVSYFDAYSGSSFAGSGSITSIITYVGATVSGKDANGNTVTGTKVTYSGQQDPNGTTYTGDYAEISNGKGTTLTPVVAGKTIANDSKGNPIQLSGITVTGGKETGVTCTITYSEDASKNMTIVWDGAATTITEPVINQTSTDSSGTNVISSTGTPNKSGSFYSNFANDQEVISIGPNLTTASKGILTLTPASGNQIGAAELTSYKLDMTKSWNFGGQVAIGGTGGADGVGFALYPGNVGQIGRKGLDLGVGGLSGAFGWTADTYANGAGATTDPAYLLQGSDSTSTGTNGTYKGSDGPSNYTLPTSGATVSNSGTNTTTQNLALNFTTGGGTNTARGGWAFSRPSGGSATNAYSVFDLTDCPTADISGFLDNSFHDFTLQYTPGTKSTKASDLAQGTIAVEYGADLTSASAPSVTTSGSATTSGTTTILPNGSTWAIQGNGNSTNAVAFSSESSASSNSNYKITIASNMAASTTTAPTATYGSALTGMKIALKSFSYKGTPYPIGTTFSYTQQGTSSSFTSGYGTVSYSTPTIKYSNVIVAKSSTTTSTTTSVTYWYASFATYSANSVDGSSDFKWSIPVAELEYNAGGASEVGTTAMSFAFLGSTGGSMNLQQVEFQGDSTANAMQSNQGFGFTPSPGYVSVGYVDFTKNPVVNLSGQQFVNNAGNPISQIKSKNASGVDVSPPTAKAVTTVILPDGTTQNNIGNEFTDQVSRMYQTLAPDVGGNKGSFDPGDGTAVPAEIFNKSTTPFSPTNPFSVSPDYTYAGIYGTASGSITSLSSDSSGNIYINGGTTPAVNLDTTAGNYDGTSMSGKYTGEFTANNTYLYYIYKPATEYANVTYVDLNGGSDGKTPTYVDPSITGANKDTSTQTSIAYKNTVGATLQAVSYNASNYTNAKTTGTNLVTTNASSNFSIPAGYQLSYAVNTTGQSGAGTNKVMTGSSPSSTSTPTIPNSSGTNAATDVSTSGLIFDWSLAENTPETITIYLTHMAASSINGTALTPILQAETINYYTNTGSATAPAGTATVATAVTNYIGFSNVYDQVNGKLLYTDWYNYGTNKPTLTASSTPALNSDGSLASSAIGWSTYNASSPPQFLSSSFPTVSGKSVNAVTNGGTVITPVPTQVPTVTATGGVQFAGYTTLSSYPTTPAISTITLNVYYYTLTSLAVSNSPTYTTERVSYVEQNNPTHQVATTTQQTITFITVNSMSGTNGSGTITGVYATYWYDGIPTTYPTVSYASSAMGTVSAPTGWTLVSTNPNFDSITNIAGKISAPPLSEYDIVTTAVENDYTTGGTNKSVSLTATTGSSNTYTLAGQPAKAGSNTVVPTSTSTSGNTDLSFTVYYTKKTWSLPYTGGIGILLIVILGAGITSFALILRKRKKWQAEESQS